MPVRCMEYDEMDLTGQLCRLRQHYGREKTLRPGAEFLSGMKETDRLIPVATVVFYHGEGKWTAARQLQDMLDMEGADEPLKRLVADYRMNVVCLEDLQEENFETGLREMIALMKRRKDKAAFQKYCAEQEERLGHVDGDTYELLCAMLNLPVWKKKDSQNEKREDYNMCVAFQEWMEDEKKKGIEIGEKRGEKRLGILIEKLVCDGRQEDILVASRSASARRKLYLEYGI